MWLTHADPFDQLHACGRQAQPGAASVGIAIPRQGGVDEKQKTLKSKHLRLATQNLQDRCRKCVFWARCFDGTIGIAIPRQGV